MSTKDNPLKGGEAETGPHLSNEQAESALQLLQSLASATASPDALERAFLDWSRLSDDARTNPEFGYILSNILARAPNEETAAQNSQLHVHGLRPRVEFEDIFFLNANGTIVDLSSELSNLLNLKIGDSIEPALFQAHFDEAGRDLSGPAEIIKLRDRFNIKRRILLHRLGEVVNGRSYAAIYVRVTLSKEAKLELRNQYSLTPSELDILELAVQRYNPEQISILRNSKLNTVRTHISRLMQKMESRSLNEAIGLAIEMSIEAKANPILLYDRDKNRDASRRKITIPDNEAVVEYTRYGPTSGRPMIVLHSIEYGYIPPPDFIDAARNRDVCIYFPRRPGFGQTTPARTLEEAAATIGGFINTLNLQNTILVGLSTSAPLALAVQNARERIAQLVLVNHGLNTKDKTDTIEPKWIRGMIKMGLASPSSFAVAVRAVRAYFRASGKERFYKMLYASVDSDLQFVEENKSIFEETGDFILQANRMNIRLDIVSSFTPNRDLEHHISGHNSILVANGENQHWIPTEPVSADANRLGVKFEMVPGGGRNWLFVQPDRFFDLLDLEK